MDRQFSVGAEAEPRKTFRIMVRPPGRELDLENSWCQRTLCADGAICESVTLATGNHGREVSGEELDDWIATFPIEVADRRIHMRQLPPPE